MIPGVSWFDDKLCNYRSVINVDTGTSEDKGSLSGKTK